MPNVEEYSQRKTELAGWPVNIVTYRLGTVYHTSVENTDPGAWVVKAEGSTKQVAEAKALKDAEALLAKIKTAKPPTGCTSVPGF
ncbi:MAG: hypothetical protein HY596_03405 [Candidatus Omnitrophica bacterium]|nr:hypothetical protein [Candidatus Omnitrophota bacterium]